MINKRIAYLDLVKGVCMIMVVMLHLGGVGKSDYKIYPEFLWLFMLPCFFIVSGYFFSNRQQFKSFVYKKTRQLLVPYFVFLAPVYLYNWAWAYIHSMPYNQVIKQSSVHNDPLWFIFSLYIMIIIYYGLNKCVRNKIILGGIVLCMSLIGEYIGRLQIIDIKWTNSLSYMIYFYLGNMWKANEEKLYHMFKTWIYIVMALLFMAIAIPFQLSGICHDFIMQSPLYFIGALSGTAVMIWILRPVGRLPLLNFIGRNTLLILCVHQYVLFAVCRLSGFSDPWVQLAFTIMILYLFVFVVNRYTPWLVGKSKA